MSERLLRLEEVAEQLAVSLRTVERLVARCELAVIRIGRKVRVRQVDIDAYVEAARVATTVERRRASIHALPVPRPPLRPGYWGK